MFRIEVPTFLLFFSFMLSDPVFTNLLIYRTCYVSLGYNKSDCALLGMKNVTEKTAKLEEIVQPYANVISMTQNILDSLIVSAICAFFGPWSDKHGRKPILLTCLLGYALSYVLLTFLSYFEYASPWLFLIGLLFSFTGGVACYLSATFSYVSDVTSGEGRGSRMGTVEVVIVMGSLTGVLSSSYLLAEVDYYYVFAICALVAFIALLFVLVYVRESVEVAESESRFRDLFTTSHFKDMFHTVFKPREQDMRSILLVLIAVMGIFVFIINDSTVQFLYLRRAFSWSLEKYTIFQAISQALWVIGTIIAVHGLHKLLGVPETVLMVVGFLSILDGYLLYGLASKSWHIYAAGAVKLLGGGVTPLARTLLSKVVEPEDYGKMFSFLLPFEMLLGVVIHPILTLVYNATIETSPSAYNFVISAMLVIEIVLVLAVMYLLRRRQSAADYAPLEETT